MPLLSSPGTRLFNSLTPSHVLSFHKPLPPGALPQCPHSGLEVRTGLGAGGLKYSWGTGFCPWEPSEVPEQSSKNYGSSQTFSKQFHRKSYSAQRGTLCWKQTSSLPPPKRAFLAWEATATGRLGDPCVCSLTQMPLAVTEAVTLFSCHGGGERRHLS